MTNFDVLQLRKSVVKRSVPPTVFARDSMFADGQRVRNERATWICMNSADGAKPVRASTSYRIVPQHFPCCVHLRCAS